MDGLLDCDGRESDYGENNVRTQFKNWGAFTNVMYDLIFQLIHLHLSLLFYLLSQSLCNNKKKEIPMKTNRLR